LLKLLIIILKNIFFRSPSPDEQEFEIRATSADAGSEYSYGFLLWSYMSFGAENALSGVI
jgi:hypothetical protein